ncbi:unnamed protein product [Phytomonas sp. Hart1]|nr:unnamed protein product [Phytomonas sp. Hart1]|eukprot:CCW69837.1 unnamed protein product [Phytomonas sp. isolate Hart1]
MINSYFDIGLISTHEELVPVTFHVSSFMLQNDVIVRNAEGERCTEVNAGNTTVLPLWAAYPLRQAGFISVQIGSKYSLSTFREFKTDPLAPNLAAKSPYFYDAGLTLCALLGNPTTNGGMSAEGTRLASQLFQLYRLRYLKVILAAAKKGFDLSDVRDKLTESERVLLDSYLKGRSDELMWYSNAI